MYPKEALLFIPIDYRNWNRNEIPVFLELVGVNNTAICLKFRQLPYTSKRWYLMRGEVLPLTPAAKRFIEQLRFN